MPTKKPKCVSISERLELALGKFCEDQGNSASGVIHQALIEYLGKYGYWAMGPRCPKCKSEHLTRHDWLLECRECGHMHEIVPWPPKETA